MVGGEDGTGLLATYGLSGHRHRPLAWRIRDPAKWWASVRHLPSPSVCGLALRQSQERWSDRSGRRRDAITGVDLVNRWAFARASGCRVSLTARHRFLGFLSCHRLLVYSDGMGQLARAATERGQ